MTHADDAARARSRLARSISALFAAIAERFRLSPAMVKAIVADARRAAREREAVPEIAT